MTQSLENGDRRGRPPTIPHSRPSIDPKDAEAAAAAIMTGTLVGGGCVAAFEEALARRAGVRHSCAVGSGTEAIHIALRALGVGPNDEVIIPAYVCAAPLLAVRHAGAVPVLADVNPETGISEAPHFRAAMTRRTKAIVAVHLFGRAAPVGEIARLGVPVIEDCAQSVGGKIGEKPLGSWGDIGVFSFYATKVITTGRGGMIATDDRRIIERVRDLVRYDERDDDALAFNSSMASFQAALGNSQLERLDSFIAERRNIYESYVRAFSDAGIGLALPSPPGEDIHYRFIVKAGGPAERIIARLNRLGVGARRPVYRPLWVVAGKKELSGTKRAYSEDVSVPIYPALTIEERERVIRAVLSVFGKE